MKPFDIILNHMAGERNPYKKIIFLRYSGRYLICVADNGEEVRFYRNDKDKFLEVVGHINISDLINNR